MKDKILGAIYGHLVGDALGVPYEFKPPNAIPERIEWRGYGTHNQPPGTWSDDGALMLCLLASIVERRGFDPKDVGQRFIDWFDKGYMAAGGLVFDYGGATATAIDRLRQGINPLEAGPDDERSNGNGSLMRILPLSLWASSRPLEEQIDLTHHCSKITHGHTRSQVCCAVYSIIVRLILEGAHKERAIDDAWELVRNAYKKEKRWSMPFLEELFLIQSYTSRTGTGYVVDCLLSSLDALNLANDYVDAVEHAIRCGNDTDTTAAVTGGVAGLIFGLDSIPSAWRKDLRIEHSQVNLINLFVENLL